MNVRGHFHALFGWIGERRLRHVRAGGFAHEEHRHFVQLVQLDPLAIEGHFEFLALRSLAEYLAEAELRQRQLDQVFAVQREVVPDHRAAARSERQAVQRCGLRQIPFDRVGDVEGRGLRIAHCQPADLGRRGHVAFQQGRRYAQDVGDVVEAAAGIVGRQQRGGVDIHCEQVADGVGVLAAIHAMQRRTAGVGIRRGGAIQRAFHGAGKRVQGLAVRAARARRRHHARPHLAHHFLPGFGVGADVIEVQLIECQAAGFQTFRCGR